MKQIIFILAMLLAISVGAQKNDTTKSSSLDLGITFSPDYCYRILKTDDANQWMKQIYDTLETRKYGYTLGMNLLLHLNKDFFVGSGLFFSDKGERTKKYVTKPVNNYINHYYYLDIPLKACYYLIKKKAKIFITLGASTNIYLMRRTVTEPDDTGRHEIIKSGEEISRVNFSFVGGLGMDCPLTNDWYFRIEPSYRRSVTPISNTSIKKYLYSYGVNIGLFYHL